MTALTELLPPGRRFVALPSRGRPVVIAEDLPRVRDYVRTALLASPPGSAVPDWAYAAAREVLRIPGAWRLAPHLVGRPDFDPDSELAGLLAASGSAVLVLNHSHDPDSRRVLLLFEPGKQWPTLAVKLPTGPDAAAKVHAETELLHQVAKLDLGPLTATVPAVVDTVRHNGFPALVTTALPGTPMLVDYHRHGHIAHPRTAAGDFSRAARWLAVFQSATRSGFAPLDLAPGTEETLRERRPGDPMLAELPRLRSRLRQYRAPRTAVHGDFWLGNLLTHERKLTGVVDWERFEPAGSPGRDLARFALAHAQYLDRHTRPGHRVLPGHPELTAGVPGAALSYVLSGTGWYPRLVRGYLAGGLRRLGLPLASARDLLLAELAALVAEATDADFADAQATAFQRVVEQAA
ncbi:MAG TPA: aminoglycoside phosphotransferase family protein [Pseudonocardiaceae bacterium]|nr:aminoglycoside phosphotransferase family protein [Pseudonocardiaceae bacterium]